MRSRSAGRGLSWFFGFWFALPPLLDVSCTSPSNAPAPPSGPAPAVTSAPARTAELPDASLPALAVADAAVIDGPLADAADADKPARSCDAGAADSPAMAAPDGGDGGSPEAPRVELPPAGKEVRVPGDSPVYVLDAVPGNQHALVYLHGRCGRIHAVDTFQHAAAEHGTLIALRGDRPCPEQRRRWSTDMEELHERVQRALRAVKKARQGELRTTDVTLFGYSQGAQRAESLAARYPRVYRRVILGGPPTRPSPELLSRAKAVAVFGGDSETHEKMQLGAEDLIAAGKKARFFLIPCAGHGDFGPEAERVMGEILSFVADEPTASVADAGSD